MQPKHHLIQLLADGKSHSGQELGGELGMTRAGVWKIIQQLQGLGIEVLSIKGKGYRIKNGIELLNLDSITQNLAHNIHSQCNIELLTEIDSTNQYLLSQQQALPSGSIVLAEYQFQGRGRRHKPWQSPFGTNLYCSFLYHIDKDPSTLSGLSLAAGVAVARMLQNYGLSHVQLKWPNDILCEGKKIAGILIEISAETNSCCSVIIGVGLNLMMPNDVEIDQAWTDVSRAISQKPNRNTLAAHLITEIVTMFNTFQRNGFQPFINQWQELDAFYDQSVVLQTPSQCYQGIAKGINKQGEVLILIDGNIVNFSNGEVSLRKLRSNSDGD